MPNDERERSEEAADERGRKGREREREKRRSCHPRNSNIATKFPTFPSLRPLDILSSLVASAKAAGVGAGERGVFGAIKKECHRRLFMGAASG